MNTQNEREYESTVNTLRFCEANRQPFETAPTGPALITELGRHVGDMDRLSADQRSGRGMAFEAASVRSDRRAALLDSIDAIVAAAGVAALTTTGIDRRFSVGPRRSIRSEIEWARTFLADAQPYTAALTTAGLPKQVLADLPGQVDALEKVLADEQIGRKKHVDARQSLASVMRARTQTLRGLDTIARSVFRTDPDKLAAWKHARRVGPKATAPVAEPTPATPAQPALSKDAKAKAS